MFIQGVSLRILRANVSKITNGGTSVLASFSRTRRDLLVSPAVISRSAMQSVILIPQKNASLLLHIARRVD